MFQEKIKLKFQKYFFTGFGIHFNEIFHFQCEFEVASWIEVDLHTSERRHVKCRPSWPPMPLDTSRLSQKARKSLE